MERVLTWEDVSSGISVFTANTLKTLEKFYTSDEISALSRALPTPPLQTTIRVNTLRTTREELKRELHGLLSAKKGMRVEDGFLPDMLVVRSPPPAPLRVASGTPQVIVDAGCARAVMRGANVFYPGVLGCERSVAVGSSVLVVCDLSQHVLRGWVEPLPLHTARDPDNPGLVVGVGVAKFCRADINALPQSGVAVEVTERFFECPSLNGVLDDKMFLQNEPSMLVAHALQPQKNEMILDCCAAPGGKTTHVAMLMGNEGTVVATDRAKKRVAQLAETCERLGCTCVRVAQADATKLVFAPTATDSAAGSTASAVGKRRRVAPCAPTELCTAAAYLSAPAEAPAAPRFAAETFDRILVDAPCSGIGLRPTLVPDVLAENDLAQRGEMQRRIVERVWPLLKRGGVLVYSTCTLNPLEGEGVVKWLAAHLPDAALVPAFGDGAFDAATRRAHHLCGEHCRGGVLGDAQQAMVVRFDPSKDPDNPAFFLAKFVKRAPQ